MKRTRLVCTTALLTAVTASAQAQTSAGSDWSKVQAIPSDTAIRVSTGKTTICRVTFVDKDLLRCVETQTLFFFPIRNDHEFQRTEIRSVKLSRQGLSTLAGATIGAGAGAGIGGAIDAQAKDQAEEGHLLTVLFALFGGLFGSGIGKHTDFTAGPTIYRAP